MIPIPRPSCRTSNSGVNRDHRICPDGAGGSLFSAIPHPVLEYRLDRDEPIVTRVNQAFIDSFSPTNSYIGDPLSSLSILFPGEDNTASSPVIDAARSGEPKSIRFGQEATDLSRSYWVRVVPVEAGGYVIFSDAHTVGDTPNRLEIIDFLTHSIRNPLEVAEIHVEVARDSGDTSHLEEVHRAHERIERIAKETTELARQGEMVGETTPTDVGAVANDAWNTVNTKEATLEVAAPGTIMADQGRLRELMENVFHNAVVHGAGDEINTTELTVSVDAMSNGFYVADNGSGIPESERDQITDMGFTTSDEGTGVGMAIVRDIATSHGWSLNVAESEHGGLRLEFTGVHD